MIKLRIEKTGYMRSADRTITKSFNIPESTRIWSLWRDETGSLLTEAAILLPIFLVGLMMLAYLIKGFYIQESIHAIAADQAIKLSVESAAADPLQPELTYGYRLNERIHQLDTESDFHVRTDLNRWEDDFQIRLQYEIPMEFPLTFEKRLLVGETLTVRSWTGKINGRNPLSFRSMEQEDDSHTVYVFPKAGERFHKEGCRYVTVYPVERILTEEVRRKYSPCKLCDAKTLSNGSVVYCFENSGDAFHRFDCTSVRRYVITMSEEDARQQGYGVCSKCI